MKQLTPCMVIGSIRIYFDIDNLKVYYIQIIFLFSIIVPSSAIRHVKNQ